MFTDAVRTDAPSIPQGQKLCRRMVFSRANPCYMPLPTPPSIHEGFRSVRLGGCCLVQCQPSPGATGGTGSAPRKHAREQLQGGRRAGATSPTFVHGGAVTLCRQINKRAGELLCVALWRNPMINCSISQGLSCSRAVEVRDLPGSTGDLTTERLESPRRRRGQSP